MRNPAAFDITIPSPQGWRWMVLTLVVVALAVVLAWWFGPRPPVLSVIGAGLGLVSLVAVGVAWSASLIRPCRLRWDGAEWRFGYAPCVDDDLLAGRLRVMIDLSFALLLHFEGSPSSGRPAVRWIPAHRGGLPGHWHALRCAVYSARPRMGSLTSSPSPRTALLRAEPNE